MAKEYLLYLHPKANFKHIGGKAEQISHLISLNIRTPPTYVCIWDAYAAYQHDSASVLADLKQEIKQKLDLSKLHAVRSSANVEDKDQSSFAGQFDSLLNVKGLDNLLEAIQSVWESTQKPSLKTYLENSGLVPEQLRMAVILQEMVNPVVSGVVFSKNPMTGLDEIVVEAVAGSGEALVQDGVTPDQWVYKWGAWTAKPEHTAIDEAIIGEVVTQTKVIAQSFAKPVDLEWVYSGTAVYFVQLREITTINDIEIYSNRISREVLPGVIKPLVWSINIPLVNSAWIDIFTELIGPNGIEPDKLSHAFNYQAYFNMSLIGQVFAALGLPQETLELMMGLQGGDDPPKFRPNSQIIKHIPRMIKFTLTKLWYGREIEAFLPEMGRVYAEFAAKPLSEMGIAEIWDTLEALIAFTRQAAYMNIVGPLLMQVYNGLLNHRLTKLGVDFERFDVTYGLAEMAQYDPKSHLDRLYQQFCRLDKSMQAQIKSGSYLDFQAMADVPVEFKTAVNQFITQFGHLSDSGNDFSRVPWRENPDFVLDMIVNREHVGPNKPNETGYKKLHWETLPLSKSTKWRLLWLYRRARLFRLYREAISFQYTYGYGLIRNYVLALADILVQRGRLVHREDIFYLYKAEVQNLLTQETGTDFTALVATRKQEITSARNIVLPEIIYGNEAPPWQTYDKDVERLNGVPTSGGYFTGPVCVVRRTAEFDKMAAGAVLVIPYSDVSWTPLFARAGAVIAESGGILSHSSIVAREYHIPAVVSVNGACHLLHDGLEVTVDGYKGEVLIGESISQIGLDRRG